VIGSLVSVPIRWPCLTQRSTTRCRCRYRLTRTMLPRNRGTDVSGKPSDCFEEAVMGRIGFVAPEGTWQSQTSRSRVLWCYRRRSHSASAVHTAARCCDAAARRSRPIGIVAIGSTLFESAERVAVFGPGLPQCASRLRSVSHS
jgi:hypothetical protein